MNEYMSMFDWIGLVEAMLRKDSEAFRDNSTGLKSPRRCRKNWKKGRDLNSFLAEYYVFSGMREMVRGWK
jgi:hypothetical protein